MPEVNDALLRNFLEEQFHNDDLFNQLYSHCAYHEPSGQVLRGEQVQQFRRAFTNAFSGVRCRIEHCSVVGRDVWMHWIFSGVHTGEFQGLPPTGRSISLPMMTLSRFENGKIVEEWELADIPGLMQQIDAPANLEQDNKALVRGLFDDCFNARDASALERFLDGGCIIHMAPGGDMGFDQYRQLGSAVFAAFPDGRYTIDRQIADGERVVTYWTWTGTHNGQFFAIAPTGRKLTGSGMMMSRIAGGRIIESHESWDAHGLYCQMGSTPEAAANQAIARTAFDIIERRELERTHEVFAFDVHSHHTGVPDMAGIEQRSAFMRLVYAAVPDIHWEIDSMIAGSDAVVVRYHWIGTHRGDWLGIAPTGKTISGSNTTIMRIRDGKITEEYTESDMLGLCRQLGALPPALAAELHLAVV